MSDTEPDPQPAAAAASPPLTENGMQDMIRQELRAALQPSPGAAPGTSGAGHTPPSGSTGERHDNTIVKLRSYEARRLS